MSASLFASSRIFASLRETGLGNRVSRKDAKIREEVILPSRRSEVLGELGDRCQVNIGRFFE